MVRAEYLQQRIPYCRARSSRCGRRRGQGDDRSSGSDRSERARGRDPGSWFQALLRFELTKVATTSTSTHVLLPGRRHQPTTTTHRRRRRPGRRFPNHHHHALFFFTRSPPLPNWLKPPLSLVLNHLFVSLSFNSNGPFPSKSSLSFSISARGCVSVSLHLAVAGWQPRARTHARRHEARQPTAGGQLLDLSGHHRSPRRLSLCHPACIRR